MLSPENWELRTVWKRHTGVLEGTPSSKTALRDAHGRKMPQENFAMLNFCTTGLPTYFCSSAVEFNTIVNGLG